MNETLLNEKIDEAIALLKAEGTDVDPVEDRDALKTYVVRNAVVGAVCEVVRTFGEDDVTQKACAGQCAELGCEGFMVEIIGGAIANILRGMDYEEGLRAIAVAIKERIANDETVCEQWVIEYLARLLGVIDDKTRLVAVEMDSKEEKWLYDWLNGLSPDTVVIGDKRILGSGAVQDE